MAEIEETTKELSAALEMLHGECRACKYKPMTPYICLSSDFCGQEIKQFAIGKCTTCKYAFKSMILPMTNANADKDNWEFVGIKVNGSNV